MRRSQTKSNGWVFIDILMGLMLVGLIAAMLGAAAGWHYRALRHLVDSRSASREAESALISLQSGEPAVDSKFTCRQIANADVTGMSWVEITVTINGRSASLVGLVPQKSLQPGGGS